MPIIRSNTTLFSTCAGPFICCSPEAAKLVGLEAAAILNNLIISFEYCHYFGKKDELYQINGNYYLKLEESKYIANMHNLFDELDVQYFLTRLQDEKLIHVISINGENFYTILFEKE